MNIARLVKILKAANANLILLDDFQRGVVADRSYAYARLGNNTNITSKQEEVLEEVAQKLYLDE